MITLASHKTFADKVKASQATAALFIYSDRQQAKEFYDPAVNAVGKRNCNFKAIQMNDVQPGRNRGNALPSIASVMDIIKFFALNHDREVVVCDIRGKGLAVSAAIIGRFIHHNAGRKAIEEVMHTHAKGTANGFVLRLADTLINSNLAAAAESFGKSTYTTFTPSAYRSEFEALQKKRDDEAKAKAAEKEEEPPKDTVKDAEAASDDPKATKATAKASKPK